MPDQQQLPELGPGEKILEERPYEDNAELVSDGNSRWERVGDTLYFIVNDDYLRPDPN